MSNRAMSWAIDVTGIPFATKGVLMLLADCHNGETGQCNPSEEWLCRKTGLAARSIRHHLKALEDAGLIERQYKHKGRGQGKASDGFHLKLGILGAVDASKNDEMLRQDTATAEFCHGKNTSLLRQDIATYIEEPEKNRKNTSEKPETDLTGNSALDEIWPHWSKAGRQRSKSKANLAKQLNSLSKTEDLGEVVKACKAYAKATAGEYHKALNSFLSGGQWQNWIGRDMTPPVEETTLEDWQAAARTYCDLNVWNGALGPAPHEPDCRAPRGLLVSILKAIGENHRRAPGVRQNIERKAA